ncbi:hypothetical protein UlMin_032204 [Ulmus minor]
MGSNELHIFFLPFFSQGHLIPITDMAKLFASKGAKATIIITSRSAPFVTKIIQNNTTQINILIIKFPCAEAGLPEGIDGPDKVSSPEMLEKFLKACAMLKPQVGHLLQQHRPNCLVADTFFPWATDVAATNGIPTFIFHSTGFFSLCATLSLFLHAPQMKVSSDSELFTLPNLPYKIEFSRNKLAPHMLEEDVETEFSKLYKETRELELYKSNGVLVNSFYELEQAYADHYRKALRVKAWHIGPVSLHNKKVEEKAKRGMDPSVDAHQCLKWLNSKKPNSVLYVCFGSMAQFKDEQLLELAKGLEASGKPFIWVLRKEKQVLEVKEEWLPDGFEERIEGKGLIIRGWAPQVVILEHEAIGGFVSHCGWNSALEAVCAGVPMVTWPVEAEQFFNEKLVTQILGIGVGVGVKKWVGGLVRKEDIEKAANRIMEGEEAMEIRSRARKLGEMARKAIEEGGSSYLDLDAFFEDLKQSRVISSDHSN